MSDSEETVYVVSRTGNGGRNHVHTDPDCHHLQRAKNVFDKPRHLVSDDARLCRFCSGDHDPAQNSTGDTAEMRKTLAATAPEDLGLSALGERSGQDGGQS